MTKTEREMERRRYTPHGGEHLMSLGNTGYEKLGEKIWPAPCVYREMEEIVERENGLRAYIEAMNRYIVEQFRELAAKKKEWWEEVYRIYQLDSNKVYQWHAMDKRVEPVPEKEPEKKPTSEPSEPG